MANETRPSECSDDDHDAFTLTTDQLRAEMNNENEMYRSAARTAWKCCTVLVLLRATENETQFEDEWKTILDRDKLAAEIDGPESLRRRIALEVADEVGHVEALCYARDAPVTLNERILAMQVGAKVRHQFEEYCNEKGFKRPTRPKN